jgi:Metal-dependent proteases with possible chaperone activity
MKPQPAWSSARATGGRILSNIVRSQTEEHAAFGGVVPEIAARAHVDLLDGIVDRAMKEAGIGFARLSAVAAAAGPGLIGGVIVGLTTAKAIAMVHDTPLIAVNHLEAHALTPRLTCALAFPYCLFLASGGHTQIVAVVGVGKYVRLGTTVDDAMGEAFDKTAKMLGLPYPGGPEVERAARRRRQPLRISAADARARRCQFLPVGIEDRRAQRSQPADAAAAAGHCRSLRQLSGRGAGIDGGQAERRPETVSRTVRPAARIGRRRRRRRQSGDPRRAAGGRRNRADHADHPAARAVHR